MPGLLGSGDSSLNIIIRAKDEASRELKKVKEQAIDMDKTLRFAKIGIVAAAAAGGLLAKQMISAAGSFEQSKIAMTTMLGSAEQANTMLRDLAEFATKTPFELQGIEQSAKQLLAYGVEANKIIPTLKSLGDVSAGLGVPLGQVAYAYGQVRAANKLLGTELRQFINAGVPLLQELSDMFGVTTAEIQKMVSEGKISFADVEQAFENMTSAGGKFENLMEKQSHSFVGMVSNLKDSWGIFLRTQGNQLIIWAKVVITQLAKILDWLRADAEGANIFGSTIYRVVNNMIALWNTIRFVIDVFVGFIDVMYQAGKVGFAFVKDMFNNFTSLGTRLKGIFSAMGKAIKGDFEGAKETIKEQVSQSFQNTLEQFRDFSFKMEGSSNFITDSFNRMGDSWLKVVDLEGFNNLQEKFAELAGASETMATGIEDSNEKAEEQLSKLAEKYSEMKDKIFEVLESLAEKHEDSLLKIREQIEETQDKIKELYSDRSDKILDARSEFAEKYVSLEEKMRQKQEELARERANADSADDLRRVRDLEDWINKNQAAMQRYQDVALSVNGEIQKAREEYYKSEAEKLFDDLKEKERTIGIEFGLKFHQYQRELRELEKKQVAEQDMFKKQVDFIGKLQEEGNKMYKDQLANRENITSDYLDREIKKWNDLANAIARASKGSFTPLPSSSLGVSRQHGGIVPGPVGQPVPILAHGQERVVPASSARSERQGGFNVVINNPSVRSDGDILELRRQVEKALRSVMLNNKIATT